MPHVAPSKFFPPAEVADSDGLMLIGGLLTPEWLLDAYRHGIFPWPIFEETELLAWWSPDPRAVLDFQDLRVTRRLRRTIRSGKFRITCNQDFAGVIRGCATAQDRSDNTWLNPDMIAAYEQMHRDGYAMSVEAWLDDRLVGGTYGLSLGGVFAAESMFYLERDASKVVVVALVEHLQTRGYTLLDLQQLTDHTARLGARDISRDEYLQRLLIAQQLPVSFGTELEASST